MSSGKVLFPIFREEDIYHFSDTLIKCFSTKVSIAQSSFKIIREVEDLLTNLLFENKKIILKIHTQDITATLNSSILAKSADYGLLELKLKNDTVSFRIPGLVLDQLDLTKISQSITKGQKASYNNFLRKELMLKNAEISELAKAKSDLINFVAHEVRGPLNIVLGYMDLLKDNEDAIPKSEIISIVEQQANDIRRLMNEVLDLSKLGANKVKVELKEVCINSFFRDYNKNFKMVCHSHNHQSFIKMDTQISDGLKINVDEFRLKQILTNFLTNAVKFAPENGGEIHLDLKKSHDNIKVSIQDNGPGFDDEFHSSLFGEFNQESTQVTKLYGGSGLGLSISKKLAKLMGISIFAESKKGAWARFGLIIPIAKNQ